MSQNFVDNSYEATRKPANVDMNYFEGNFLCLKTSFSGDSIPSDSVPFQLWGDTTNKVKRFKDHSGNYWYGLFHGDGDQKIWQYRNDALDGWVIDSTPSDVVISIKGSSGDIYDQGGQTGSGYGDWDGVSGLEHCHRVYGLEYKWEKLPGDDYATNLSLLVGYDASGDWQGITEAATWNGNNPTLATVSGDCPGSYSHDWATCTCMPDDASQETFHDDVSAYFTYTETGPSDWDSSWRPQAAVGTLQGLDI